MTQALAGLRVLDLTQGMAGPLATMILADYGADVIRVEPQGGDPLWSLPAYLLWNRGKKSIELSWSSGHARQEAARLLSGTDVLIETWGPDKLETLGIGYEKAKAINPAIVYCSISAFGQAGPYRDLKAYDGIVNAKSGRMRDQVGHYHDRPIYRAVNDTSFHTAMFAVQGVLAALRVAWMTGHGQHVETSLLRGVTAPNNAWIRFDGQQVPPDRYPSQVSDDGHLSGELVPNRHETDPSSANPAMLCTQCKDGVWIMHANVQVDLFRSWITAIGLEWIFTDSRFKGAPNSFENDVARVELNEIILRRMREKDAREWIGIYVANPDCVGEIMQTTQEALRHPQLIHNGSVVRVNDPRVGVIEQIGPLAVMSVTPATIRSPAPTPGQHTSEILQATSIQPKTVAVSSDARPKHPLEGVTILEFATWLAAPFACALLADLGARIIKVEPLGGDPYRKQSTNENMLRATQGKQSIALNLKTKQGQDILHKLAAKADVLLHNYRPGVPKRIGLDYETMRGIKPDLVYVYAASYGSTGPHSLRAAFNPTMGAMSGNSVFQSGEGNIPIGDQSPDPIAGSAVATAIMLGLAARLRTGQGQYVETTMITSVVYCNSDDALAYQGKPRRRTPDKLQLGLEATYRLYKTLDGWVFLASPCDGEFEDLCRALNREDLLADIRFGTWAARYANRAALGEILETIFEKMRSDEWETRLTGANVGCVSADRFGHRRFLYHDPHTRAIGFMVPSQHDFFRANSPGGRYWRHGPVLQFSGTACVEGLPFVELGEHTRRILAELGYSGADVENLRDTKVVDWRR